MCARRHRESGSVEVEVPLQQALVRAFHRSLHRTLQVACHNTFYLRFRCEEFQQMIMNLIIKITHVAHPLFQARPGGNSRPTLSDACLFGLPHETREIRGGVAGEHP